MLHSVVLASGNRGKLAELSQILAPYRVSVRPLSQFTHESAEETGSTFQANALLKARFAARVAQLPAIADDSGLEVDALDGAPGVYSARYSGQNATDAANNQKLLRALEGVGDSQRTARFRCVLAYLETADADPLFAEGVWEGRIAMRECGTGGFGYDPLFVPVGFTVTAAAILPEEKNRISHRAQALRDLAARLFARVSVR